VTARKAPGRPPGLRLERDLLARGATTVAGVDEVGRGALAGPVTVGIVVVDAAAGRPPTGLRDSKLITPASRESLVPRIRRWAPRCAVGHASPAEIDTLGMTAALRLAGWRAMDQLADRPERVVLDGNHDWFSVPAQIDLFDASPAVVGPTVVTRIKADLTCASVAAASVLAKTVRDRLMTELAGQHPGYGWDENKGYASPAHHAAIDELGPSPLHRLSWRLGDADDEVAAWRVTMDLTEVDDVVDLNAGSTVGKGSPRHER
jgi:ribonuclease HII